MVGCRHDPRWVACWCRWSSSLKASIYGDVGHLSTTSGINEVRKRATSCVFLLTETNPQFCSRRNLYPLNHLYRNRSAKAIGRYPEDVSTNFLLLNSNWT